MPLCGTMKAHHVMGLMKPGFDKAQANIYQQILERAKQMQAARTQNGTQEFVIPMAFHVVWNNADHLVDRDRIMLQIGVLNNAFRGQDPDFAGNTPDHFKDFNGDAKISFCLGKYYDESGVLRDAITYTKTDHISSLIANNCP